MNEDENGFGYYGANNEHNSQAYIDGDPQEKQRNEYVPSNTVKNAKDFTPIPTLAYLVIDLAVLSSFFLPVFIMDKCDGVKPGLVLHWVLLVWLSFFHKNVNVNRYSRYHLLLEVLVTIVVLILVIAGIINGFRIINTLMQMIQEASITQ